MTITITSHLIRKADLNHHETLFAGRSAEWLIETAYMSAVGILKTDAVVAVNVRDICYLAPAHAGEIIRIEGRPIYAGNTSLTVYVSATVGKQKALEGFVAFVHVGTDGHSEPHGITIEPATAEERALQERARKLLSC